MTTAQIEQRLSALEQTVAGIQEHLTKRPADESSDDEIIPGAEYELTTNVPPKAEYRFRARIVVAEKQPSTLGLSPEEWASLWLGDEGE
jgi:hypothetical protein